MKYVTAQAILNFLMYFGAGVALLAMFTRVYLWVTPYHEMNEIRACKKAPAIALMGAMFGFVLPLVTMSWVGVNFADFLIWSLVAMIIQLACFKILYMLIPAQIEADNQAVALVFAGCAVCIGAINAFSLIPQ